MRALSYAKPQGPQHPSRRQAHTVWGTVIVLSKVHAALGLIALVVAARQESVCGASRGVNGCLSIMRLIETYQFPLIRKALRMDTPPKKQPDPT